MGANIRPLFLLYMTGYFKWIGAFLGFYLSRFHFFGAIAGFILGGFIDNIAAATQQAKQEPNRNRQRSYSNQQQSIYDLFEPFQRQNVSRYDFPTVILILSAAVMKADDRVLKSELNFVKEFLKRQFGAHYNQTYLTRLKSYVDQSHLPLNEVCGELRMRMQAQNRVQILHYLFGIAQADGNVSDKELHVLHTIANYLGVPPIDYQQVQQSYHRDTKDDYTLLGIDKSATDAEVKKAYRKMAIKYHPDKVAQLDQAAQNKHTEKFQEIQDAYEAIKKERGI